ncbi:Uncharacterized protein FKW44_017536, partial [Caligus rogercresseyi]
ESYVHSVEARIRTEHEKGDDDYCESPKNEETEQAALNRERSLLEIEKKEFTAMKEEFLKEIISDQISGRDEGEESEGDSGRLLLPSGSIPTWSQGTASYTVPDSELKSHSLSGVNIGPLCGASSGNATPINSQSSSRNGSRAGELLSASRRSTTGVPRRNTNRPRSTNLSP